MKAIGIEREDGKKDYMISHGPFADTAVRHGQKFKLSDGFVGTLKACKTHVELHGMIGDREPEVPPENKSSWDCIDPCAWIIKILIDTKLKPESGVYETLNCYGWVLHDGTPDFDKVKREFNRLKTKENKDEDSRDSTRSETRDSDKNTGTPVPSEYQHDTDQQ